MRVRVLSRAEVEAGGAEGADAVISICALRQERTDELKAALAQATRRESARLLTLSFDDIGLERYGAFVGPTMEDVSRAIEFGRRVAAGTDFFDGPSPHPPLIAVHCEYGESRSAAIALALLADSLGPGREREAVNTLLRLDIEDRMHPNPRIVSLADACLFRYGRLDQGLQELSPRYAQSCAFWQKAAVQEGGS